MNTQQSRREYQRRISLAVDYINQHLDSDISPEHVASVAQFSKFHFYRLFKAMTGDSVLGFVRRLRLERAASQLRYDERKSITAIALDARFATTQSFAKAFQKRFLVSPSQYRLLPERSDGHPQSTFGNDSWRIDNDNAVSQKNKKQLMNITVKELPEKHVAYIRRFGPYGLDIGPYFQKLAAWAGPRGLIKAAAMFGTYWDNPEITPPEKCRTDACLEVPQGTEVGGEVVLQTLPGGQYAVYRVALLATEDGNEFYATWQSIYTDWLPDSGYQPDDKPAYENYLAYPEDHSEGKWDVEICIPVKPL